MGGGGYDHEKNLVIGRSPEVDVLLFDTAGPDPDSGELYDRFVAGGVEGKPIVNVELFGGWTRRFERGVFPEEVKRAYRREVDAAASRPGLSVFFHNNPWCQREPMRYDLGGSGYGRRSGHPLVLRACAGHEGRVGRSGWGGRGRARVSRWSGTKPTCSTTDAEPGRALVASARSS